ncbi:penicillin-binding protein [Actinomadura barringtoniae]|uniref:Penicillin-binding protein n=1 Tax=Actinomadura barringtoniae TaxID=1427535 RepID=A0A939PFR9_9ACTN|nr:transglycosylase domain-containing protein [Actinomadura barringtoniae]MBO2448384.1 penicillin-binding protein [Actinomadura barringtoniae]
MRRPALRSRVSPRHRRSSSPNRAAAEAAASPPGQAPAASSAEPATTAPHSAEHLVTTRSAERVVPARSSEGAAAPRSAERGASTRSAERAEPVRPAGRTGGMGGTDQTGRGTSPPRARRRLVRRWRGVPFLLKGLLRSARWRRSFYGLVAVMVLFVAGVVVAYVRTPIPTEPQKGVTDQGSAVYYADGRTPAFRLGANREVVRHGQIPDRLRWAVLAAEDRGFYGGHGISLEGMTRAFLKTASGGETQGGSTITQQLARNYFKGLSKKRTIDRKAKEIFISVKLARSRSKDAILDLYLNTVYFGRDTSGVQAAARAYFDKDVWQLSVGESALLAAMIQRPTYFKTQGDDAPARALRARWQYVIDGMVKMGELSRAEAGQTRFPATRSQWSGVNVSGQTLLLRQRVLEELRQLDIPPQSVVNGRMKIYTGIDPRWMAYAEQAMKEQQEPNWPRTVRSGLIAVDPQDGAVKAFYGGDPKRSQYDSVFNPVAQAGSTFKPYVLAAALRRGFNVRSLVSGKSPVKFAPNGELTPMTAPGYLVNNDEKIGSLGAIDLVKATALSVNTGYVKLAFEAGLDNVVRTAEDLGVPASALKPFRGQAGITLGMASISAVDQAAGYAAFANGGNAVTPHVITKIVDADGHEVPLPWGRTPRKVLTDEQAAQTTYALRQTVADGTGKKAALADRDAAGKTGTTDHNHAAWFVGFVPQLSTAVVMTNTAGKPLQGLAGQHGTVAGEGTPSTIWHSFMSKVTSGMPYEPFAEPVFSGIRRDWATGFEVPGTKPAKTPGTTPSPRTTPTPGATTPPTPSPKDKAELDRFCKLPENRNTARCKKSGLAR